MDAHVKLFSRGDADEGVVFIGDPGSLSGDVWLENREGHQLEFRRASLVSRDVRPAELTATDRITQIFIPKYIRPHQRQLVSVSFDLDPSTPPGTYPATIVLEGADGTATFPAQIIVTQNYALTIEPDQLVASVEPGGTFDGEVVVVNEGNVPIDVVPLGEYPLEDPARTARCCCCCHDGDDEREADDDEGLDEPDFGAVAIDNRQLTVEPGRSALVRFVAHVPDTVPANMHLRARPRIGIERFSLDVITRPAGLSGGDSVTPNETVRRRSPQKKKKRS
jgi:hypothetical protein